MGTQKIVAGRYLSRARAEAEKRKNEALKAVGFGPRGAPSSSKVRTQEPLFPKSQSEPLRFFLPSQPEPRERKRKKERWNRIANRWQWQWQWQYAEETGINSSPNANSLLPLSNPNSSVGIIRYRDMIIWQKR